MVNRIVLKTPEIVRPEIPAEVVFCNGGCVANLIDNGFAWILVIWIHRVWTGVQGNIYLTAGTTLLSNRGNPLLDIVADTCGRHDTLGGACAAESNTVRYALEKKCMHACRDSWMLAVSRREEFGLGKRDITHNINFFMNVPVTPEGGLTFEDGISDAGKYVELIAHMDVLVLISNCPQLNNPCNAYNPTPIEILIWDA